VLCSTLLLLSPAAVNSQMAPSAQTSAAPPVSYSSVSQLNMMLSQVEQASQSTQLDLAKLRVDKWKTDSGTKRQADGNVDSLQRNLQSALPEIIAQLKASPEDLTSTFKLYRNLDALYGVLGSVAESAGAFGSKDEFQSLGNDVNSFERARRVFADRMESLAAAKEAELARLRTTVQTAQAAAKTEPPKKVVVDDTEPVKKPPAKKKPAPKPSASTPQPAPQNPPKPQ
jgi:hypothetical protein